MMRRRNLHQVMRRGANYQIGLENARGCLLVDGERPLRLWFLRRLDLCKVLLDPLKLSVHCVILRVSPLNLDGCCDAS